MKHKMMGGIMWTTANHLKCGNVSIQTDYHASISSLNFYRLDAVPDAQLTVSKT